MELTFIEFAEYSRNNPVAVSQIGLTTAEETDMYGWYEKYRAELLQRQHKAMKEIEAELKSVTNFRLRVKCFDGEEYIVSSERIDVLEDRYNELHPKKWWRKIA